MHYTIATKYDEVVTPYRSQFLTGSDVHNVLLQDLCPVDLSDTPRSASSTGSPSTRRPTPSTRHTPPHELRLRVQLDRPRRGLSDLSRRTGPAVHRELATATASAVARRAAADRGSAAAPSASALAPPIAR